MSQSKYQVFLVEKNDLFVGIIESSKGIVTCNFPSHDRAIAEKNIRNAISKLNLKLDMNKLSISVSSKYSDLIFKMAEKPKSTWKEAKIVPIDYSLYTTKQQKVVETLRSLNSGEIITYGELASKAGFPNAARFVGSTMARNYVPLIVPCHRVVPANKSLGRYSGGGPEIKQKLLKFEGLNI